MKKPILLFDLDDTLLDNEIQTFLGAYLSSLSKHVHQVQAELLIRELMVGTNCMLENQNPGQTLEQVFDSHFYPAIGSSKPELAETLDDFYTRVFPNLSPITQQRPEAIALVKYAVAKGFPVGIATNPLFPRKAILHRLNWAGLSHADIPYILIPCYSSFHFAKPNPAFFAELLSQLGWPEQPVVMIGNSLADDILPAVQMGIPGFLVTKQALPPQTTSEIPYGQGTFEEILPWLDTLPAADMPKPDRNPLSLLAALKGTPAALRTLYRDRNSDDLHTKASSSEWSLTEISAHLRDIEQEIYLPRIKLAIEKDNPLLPDVSTDSWAIDRKYQSENGLDGLNGFTQARIALLDMLSQIPESAWQRPARHAVAGPMTLQGLVVRITQHDQAHLRQIRQIL